ncbi:CBS domain-containing protein [Sphingomonas crusticola]|uniref:CBS domain-containing protein n=1 Tax=Sphingomonas crusticola TaxID=1697973 RepID=UPI000E260487|nr:CBS domain-containing protein [Sphingomonas crusticola]
MTFASILQRRDGEIVQVAPGTPVRAAVELLADHRIGAVPVVQDGQVIGIMSERDVIYALRRDGAEILDWPVERVMTQPAITVEPAVGILTGLSLMTKRRIRHLPVVDGGRMVGFVSIGDLVKARIELIEGEAEAMRAYIAG